MLYCTAQHNDLLSRKLQRGWSVTRICKLAHYFFKDVSIRIYVVNKCVIIFFSVNSYDS